MVRVTCRLLSFQAEVEHVLDYVCGLMPSEIRNEVCVYRTVSTYED